MNVGMLCRYANTCHAFLPGVGLRPSCLVPAARRDAQSSPEHRSVAPRDALCSLDHWHVQLYHIWQMALEGRAVYPQHIWDKGKTPQLSGSFWILHSPIQHQEPVNTQKPPNIFPLRVTSTGINEPTESLQLPALSLLRLKTWRCMTASCQGSSSSAWPVLALYIPECRGPSTAGRGGTKPLLCPSLMWMKRLYSSGSFDHRDQKWWTTLTLCCPGLLLSISTDGKCFQTGETFKALAFFLWPQPRRTPVAGQTEQFKYISTPWTTGFTFQRVPPTAPPTSPLHLLHLSSLHLVVQERWEGF